MTKEAERFTLRLTVELKEQLDEIRKRMGVSLNALVVQILWDWAKEERIYITDAGKHYLDNRR
mgnify:CR=1 FL=1